MSTQPGPLSSFVRQMRVDLAQEDDRDIVPMSAFANMLSPTRAASSISRLESGSLRPTDDFLMEFATAFPKKCSFEKLSALRDEQFPEGPRRGRKPGSRKAKPRRSAAKSAQRSSDSEMAGMTALEDGEPSNGSQDASLQQLLKKWGGTANPDARTPTPSAAPVALDDNSDLHHSFWSAISSTVASVGHGLTSKQASVLALTCGLVLEKMVRAHHPTGASGFADLRAAASGMVVDLLGIIQGDDVRATDAAELKSILDLHPERGSLAADAARVAVAVSEGAGYPSHGVDVAVLRAFSVGARR